jgi:hypothetical protein
MITNKFGYSIAEIPCNTEEMDAWVDTLDIDSMLSEEFTFSLCKTSAGVQPDKNIDFVPLLEMVSVHMQTYVNTFNPLVELSVDMSSPWVNVYEKGGFQDVHDHQGQGNFDFSWSYVHQPGDCHIVFKNRNVTNSDRTLSELLKEYETIFDYVPHKIDKGTLYIFPSSMFHSVSPNLGETRRITFSGDIKLRREGENR